MTDDPATRILILDGFPSLLPGMNQRADRTRTTLNQIASAAGVSISTVDRVINGRGGVSAKSEARVVEWAGKLGLDRIEYHRHLSLLRIAVLIQAPDNPFYRGLRDAFAGMTDVLAAMNMRTFVHHIDVTDVQAMSAKIAQIGAQYDGMIAAFPNDARLSALLRRLADTIPIVTTVTDLPQCGRLAYVGPDNERMGRVAGELMGRYLGPEGGDVIFVCGMLSMTGHHQRERGFRAVLEERFARCRIVACLQSQDEPRLAGEQVASVVRARPDIAGIYNASTGNRAIWDQARAAGMRRNAVFITHELTPGRRQMLREGVLDAVIDQNPEIEARRALEIMGRHFGRHRLPIETGYTPFTLYIQENG